MDHTGLDLLGCNIIERDTNNEILWTWAFPTVTETQQEFVLRKCRDLSQQSQLFVFTKCVRDWCYIHSTQVFETDALPQVKQFFLVLWSKDYNTAKYEALSRLLSKRYCKTGDPSVVLKLYLSVVTTGVCSSEENGTFESLQFDNIADSNTQVKDLIKMFELETILIYTALLLNKRLFVYHHSLECLLKWIKTLPYLILHRDVTPITFPWVHLVPQEMLFLRSSDGFIAGCLDTSIQSQPESYDLLVNIAARELTLGRNKECFTMTKTHKDIAMYMVQLERSEMEDRRAIEELKTKTEDLLNLLRSLATSTTADGKKMISMENLRDRNLPQALENFLFNLAVAENIMLL